MLRCDKCSAQIIEGSKFCPQCGDPVDEKDIVTKPSKTKQPSDVVLTFGYSSSANYEKVILICKNIPSYTVDGDGKKITHQVILPITEIGLIENIYNLIGNWKSSQMLIAGKSCTKKDLTYYGIGCFRGWQEAIDKAGYCFGKEDYERNIWGCKKLDLPIYQWGGGWLEYGAFDDNGVWHFDKKRIKHELDESMKRMELCPKLNRKRVYDAIELIPENIDPNTNPNWEYDERAIEINGEYKKGAKGIKPTIKEIYYMMPEDEEKPNWDFEEDESTYTININISTEDEQNEIKQKENNNISIWVILAIAIILIMIVF